MLEVYVKERKVMSKILIIKTENDLLYCYKADSGEQKSAGVYDYLESQGFDPEEYKEIEPDLVKSYLNKSKTLYIDFIESYFQNFCESYYIESIIMV